MYNPVSEEALIQGVKDIIFRNVLLYPKKSQLRAQATLLAVAELD